VARSDFDDLVRQRLSQTVTAYYDVLEAKALLQLSKVDVENLRRVEQMTIRRIELGGAGSIELDRVRLALLNSERDVRQREVTLASAKSALRALLGRIDPDPNFDVVGNLGVAQAAPDVTVEQVLPIAEENRPDLASLRQQLAKAQADIEREETRAYPQLSGMFGFTYQQQRSTIGFPNAPSYNGAVYTTVPLFDRNQGNISRARSAYWQTNYTLQSQLTQVRAEVEQAVAAYQTARSIVTTTDPAQQASAANVRDKIAAAYEVGGRPLTEVLTTQQQYRETMRLLITGQSGYWRSLYRVNFAAGASVLK
jgi:cobalt-zinc-cadmium efflux system outer membrane protein